MDQFFGAGGGGRGSSEKKDSLQILGLPRFAYLLTSEQVWRKKNYRYTDE